MHLHHYTVTAQARFDTPVDFRKTDIDRPRAPSESFYTFIYMTNLIAESERAARLRFREDHLYPGAESVRVLTIQRGEAYDAQRYREARLADTNRL